MYVVGMLILVLDAGLLQPIAYREWQRAVTAFPELARSFNIRRLGETGSIPACQPGILVYCLAAQFLFWFHYTGC